MFHVIRDWPEARLLGNRTDTTDVDWLKISSLDVSTDSTSYVFCTIRIPAEVVEMLMLSYDLCGFKMFQKIMNSLVEYVS